MPAASASVAKAASAVNAARVANAASSKPPVAFRMIRDRLARMSPRQAAVLLGTRGEKLIQLGGKYEIDIETQVHIGEDHFRLTMPEAVATIKVAADQPKRLRWSCSACDGPCEHVGAALAVILDQKTQLGLARTPPERVPIESLTESKLIEQAVAGRLARASQERMQVQSRNADELWTDYLVTSHESGKTYRVALRGFEPGESYCSCPDYRKNTLGMCKHIMQVHSRVKSKFSAQKRARPFVQRELAVHVNYVGEPQLRLLAPRRLDEDIARIVSPFINKPISDAPRLVSAIRKIEALGRGVMVYPDAEELIDRMLFRNRIGGLTREIRRNPKSHPLRKTLLKAELLPYQLDGVAFAVGAGRAILADDMGLGKTIQGIGVAELLAREAGIKKVLVVCPTTLKSQWRNEITRFCDRDCQLILGASKERPALYKNGSFFTICNYEQVLKDITAIEQVKWDLIILDEGQRIKNWETLTSRVIKALRSQFALVLTGTPLENRLDDLFSVVEFVDAHQLGPAFRFFNEHRIVTDTGMVMGYKKLDELRARLQPLLLRRTRQSVSLELPSRTTEYIRINATTEQLEIHTANAQKVQSIVSKPYLTEMDLLRLQKALLMCRMSADSTFLCDKQAPGYSSKLVELDSLLGRLLEEDGRKIVLFSEWTTMLNLIEPLITKRNAQFVRLDGKVPQKHRQSLVNEFQSNPKCRVFLTTNAGSTGLNLQAADTIINVDLPWNPAVLEQRIARAHRMGQKRPVSVFILVTTDTIEEKLLSTLSVKRDLALAALDMESDVTTVNLVSGREELRQRLETLLGARPVAAIDESELARQAAEADRIARQERMAQAGGQMVSAAFGFLAQMIPATESSAEADRIAERLKAQLSECIKPDESGKLRLTIQLPDAGALNSLADSLARLLSSNGTRLAE